ncbi:MAG TPA: hypothetical protein VHT24_17590, partial [Pseudacidobacterium sp.]|nr:hypothetical protein [Pseudacidobacterium sp.]
RMITYTVELNNRRGHNAGPSNPAYSASGAAPSPAIGFTVKVRTEGVLLHWQPTQDASGLIRIQRTIVPHPGASAKPTSESQLRGAAAPPQQTLEVSFTPKQDPGRAFDKDAAFNQIYRYVAQRIAVVELSGRKIEVASIPSETVAVDTRDIFPPAVPTGLTAVASPDEHAINLLWSPNTENDLAGYIVYRREASSSAAPVRISPEQPVVGPAFLDTTARPGVRYAYSVSAIDQDHNESPRSPEVEETLPQ